MSAIWRRDSEGWRPLLASGFPSEAALHDLVEEAPQLLPLSGDPALVVVGREVALGTGYADLVAVEADGRVAIIEIKLRRNAEARRAVVAQVLTYAAFLRGTTPMAFEHEILRNHLSQRPFGSLRGAVSDADQTGQFDEAGFDTALQDSLAGGAFRLVLVLDEAPTELVQLVGYLEAISSGIVIDLITVSAYTVGDEQILVPQRVDPEQAGVEDRPRVVTSAASGRTARAKPVDGAEAFEQAVDRTPSGRREGLENLAAWARRLERDGLASLKSVLGKDREILLAWVPGEKAGLASIWNDGGAYISLWRSVFVRFAPEFIERVEVMTGSRMGQGSTVPDPTGELLELLGEAYKRAADNTPTWDGNSYYVSFGDGPNRSWEDAREHGFVSAGGGAWYSRSLRQLQEGNRVFVYIPKGSGVGGYVGVGDVTGPPRLAKDLLVPHDDNQVPITEVARADMGGADGTDPDEAEWVVPVAWLRTRSTDDAVRDADFFANQNTAVKFTHGYTVSRLIAEFGLE